MGHGFIHDKLDMKMLELYLMAHAAGPLDFDTLSDLALRHEGVDYFQLAEATAELVQSGHLTQDDTDHYTITEKGRANSAACESSLPFSVRRRCGEDLAPVNATLRRNAQVRGKKRPLPDGSVMAHMSLDDDGGNILTLELLCPSDAQADRLITGFLSKPEQVFHEILDILCTPAQPHEDPA